MLTQTIPMARATDPQTSHDAAKSVRHETVTRAQIRILTLLCEYGPMTDEEIAQKWHAERNGPISPSGLRTRRAELEHRRFVECWYDGEYLARRMTAAGRQSLVRRVTLAGVEYLESLA